MPTRQLRVSQHGGLRKMREWCGVGVRGCLQSVRNHDLQVTSYMHTTFPWGAARVPSLAPLSCDADQVCPCAGSSVEALQTTSFPFLGNRPPAFVLSLSTPPISQFFFFSWHNQELSEPSRNHINLTWKHASRPVFCPRCLFFPPSPDKKLHWDFLV